MSNHRAIIEFYLRKDAKFICRLETTAPPPHVGALLNFQRKDYVVEDIDFSIDLPGSFSETVYRRNVYLREARENMG